MLRTIQNKIIIKRLEPDEMRGHIYIPEKHRKTVVECEVMCIGPKTTGDIKVGDIVMMHQWIIPDSEFEFNKEKYICVREDDIHCLIEHEMGV